MKTILYWVAGILIVMGVWMVITNIMTPTSPVIFNTLGGSSDYAFARATATSTTVTVASTLVFATTTNNQMIERRIYNNTGVNFFCSANGPAALNVGIVVPASSSIVFGVGQADQVISTYGTINCISTSEVTAGASVQR